MYNKGVTSKPYHTPVALKMPYLVLTLSFSSTVFKGLVAFGFDLKEGKIQYYVIRLGVSLTDSCNFIP